MRDIGQRNRSTVDRAVVTKTNQKLDVVDSDDLNPIASKLPRDDLLKVREVKCPAEQPRQ